LRQDERKEGRQEWPRRKVKGGRKEEGKEEMFRTIG
jgi:hypothetical protein